MLWYAQYHAECNTDTALLLGKRKKIIGSNWCFGKIDSSAEATAEGKNCEM